jgi:rod shape determining protein RodA
VNIPLAWRKLDVTLFLMVLGLAACGVLLVYSASHHSAALSHLAMKQAGWVMLGLVAITFFYIIDYQALLNLAYPLLCFVLVLLVFVLVFGRSSRGAQRWFDLGALHFQPSEMAKLVVILALARYLMDHERDIKRFTGMLPAMVLAFVPMFLILRQPDLGSALVMLPILFVMLFVAGARLRHLVLIIGALLAATPLVWMFLKDYQRRRWLTFLDPERDTLGVGYNVIQSQIAIGSGGLLGKGFLQGSQSQLNFIPMHHTDFIFAVLGEEWGLAGCAAVLGFYLLFILHCVKVATQAKDLSGTLLCSGIIALLSTHIVINVGMTVGLLPVTGITLPFLSYGGSSVLLNMICVGILLNVRRESLGY